MATARNAVVEAAAPVGDRARVLDLRLTGEPEPDLPSFAGGKYVIVDTGVDLPNGKRAKRAYSLLACDLREPAAARFRIAVLRLDGGPGSAALHAIERGAVVTFSGPWGKHRAEPTMSGEALVFATDTGITAAAGLAASSAFAASGLGARVVWYVDPMAPFVPEWFVREHLGAARLVVEPGLPAGHPDRAAHALAAAERHADRIGAAFLSGDGAVLHPLGDRLVAGGLPADHVRIEAFFNAVRRSPNPLGPPLTPSSEAGLRPLRFNNPARKAP